MASLKGAKPQPQKITRAQIMEQQQQQEKAAAAAGRNFFLIHNIVVIELYFHIYQLRIDVKSQNLSLIFCHCVEYIVL